MKECKETEQIIINNEATVKPYFYIRNSLLHCRYIVDRAMLLTENEKKDIVDSIVDGKEKQLKLLKYWKSLELEKTVIQDGIREVELRYIPGKKIY